MASDGSILTKNELFRQPKKKWPVGLEPETNYSTPNFFQENLSVLRMLDDDLFIPKVGDFIVA